MRHFGEFLADYVQRGELRRLSPRTLRTAGYQVRSFLAWLDQTFGVSTPEHLRPSHLEAWQRHVLARPSAGGLPLRPRSLNRYLQSVRGFLKSLADQGLIAPEVPRSLSVVREPRLLPTSVLKHDQVQRMLTSIDTLGLEGARDQALLELLYSTGLRAAEILGLRLSDIDWTGATATVTGKGGKQRVVPIGRTALARLEHFVKSVRPFLVTNPAQTAVFLDRRGRPLPYHTFRRRVHRHAEPLGLAVAVTPHTFRRSCATELIRAGANLYHVKELLGHESLETLQHYTRLTIEDLKQTHARCHPREQVDHAPGP